MHWDPSITQRSHRSRWVSYLRWQFGENKKVAKQGNIQTTFHHPLLPHLLPELKDEENSSQTVGEFQSSPVSSIFCKWVVVLKKKKKKKMFVFKCLCSKHRHVESQQIPICFLFASEKLSWNQVDLSQLLNFLVAIHTIIAPKRIPFSPQCLLSNSQFEFLYYLNLYFLKDFMILSLMAFS